MASESPRKQGGFKNFLSSEKGLERSRKKELANLKTSLEQGSYLKAPKTQVSGEEVDLAGTAFEGCAGATASMQGWRVANEDAAVLRVTKSPDGEERVVMGVYDGHGGAEAAEYLAEHLHKALAELPKLSAPAIRKLFETVDRGLREALGAKVSLTGATCSVVVVEKDRIVCANTGDCRAVLCRGGEAFPLSEDHNPESPTEKQRIEASGSSVKNGRIEGMLNVSRAFGDFDFKKESLEPEAQAITCVCDVTVAAREPGDEFIVQACDGIWGSKTSAECIADIKAAGLGTPLLTLEKLFNSVLAPSAEAPQGTDNMTANLFVFSS